MGIRATQFRKVDAALVEHRAAPRYSVAISTAKVRRQGEMPSEAVVVDLSIYGCRVQSPMRHKPRERIWVRFTEGPPFAATVIWAKDGFAGCRFDAPMERAMMRSMTLSLI